MTIQMTTAVTVTALTSAAITSARRYPYVARADAARCPTTDATSAMTSPAASESMCTPGRQ